jgi:hypothetical protein
MKRHYILFLFALVSLSSCVTGGFDENPQLDEREEALAKAPKVETITVNGTLLQRNTQSIRVVEAEVGDVLSINAALASGKGAQLTKLEAAFTFDEETYPLDPDSPDGFHDITGNNFVYELDFEVTADFHAGDVIFVYFRVRNSLDNFGYKAFEIHVH